jgi:hypothetical protein
MPEARQKNPAIKRDSLKIYFAFTFLTVPVLSAFTLVSPSFAELDEVLVLAGVFLPAFSTAF